MNARYKHSFLLCAVVNRIQLQRANCGKTGMINSFVRGFFFSVVVFLGAIVGVGASMVRESSAVMIGHYFKRRRQCAEMVTMSGEGVGIALFSVILREGLG